MISDSYADKAIEFARRGARTYVKFLSANDTGETGGHQSGIHIARNCLDPIFGIKVQKGSNIKQNAKVRWMCDFETDSTFTYYGQGTRNESRITRFGRGFPFLDGEYTGALFVLTQFTKEYYEAFVLNSEDDINTFLDEFGVAPTETNKWLDGIEIDTDAKLQSEIDKFVSEYCNFPTTKVMSTYAQDIQETVYDHIEYAVTKPDTKLVDWVNMEYTLFRAIEKKIVMSDISKGFDDVETFLAIAKTILNRRKSRAGKGFENHLAKLFDLNRLRFETQVVTEINKKPDFLFPSLADYKNTSYPTDKLVSLAAKTTCKDRWRQIITECDRLVDKPKFLCTLQQGISQKQVLEMDSENVVLVVPEQYIPSYAPSVRHKIWTVRKFIDYIKAIEA